MNMVKHKRDNPAALTAQREDELKALAKKADGEIDYSDIPLRTMGCGQMRFAVNFIGR
jgi:hypothetical protein